MVSILVYYIPSDVYSGLAIHSLFVDRGIKAFYISIAYKQSASMTLILASFPRVCTATLARAPR